jgi:hypothetical protein
VHVHAGPLEAGAFVDFDRTLVEGRDREREPLGREPFPAVVKARGKEAAAQPPAREIRPQAQPDDERSALGLEREVADQLALVILDGEVSLAAQVRVEKLGQVVLVRRPVVEREGLGIAPARDGFGVRPAPSA